MIVRLRGVGWGVLGVFIPGMEQIADQVIYFLAI